MDTPTNAVSRIQEEENSEIVIGSSNFNFVRCSTTRKILKTDLDSLPDELLNDILIRIPAQDIFNTTILVCRKWCHISRTHKFIYDHLHRSTPALLMMNANKELSCITITPSAKIEITKMGYKCRHRIWCSCNGLVLETNLSDPQGLVITNLLTKQHFPLPPFIFPNQCPHSRSAIAYAPTQMDYKVVRTYYLGNYDHPTSRGYCAILTVGVDNSWRLVDSQNLSTTASKFLVKCPLVTEGFVHWAEDSNNNHVLSCNRIINQMTNNYVLTLNIEAESITHNPAPRSNGGYYYYKYLSGGNYLSLLIGRGNLKWEVWEMKPETREWTKLPNIDLEAHKGLLNRSYDREVIALELKPGDGDCLDCKLAPAGWLKYRDVIVFITYRPLKNCLFRQAHLRVVYNVQTKDISLFSLHDNHFHPFLVHKNSLIRLPG